MTKRLNILLVVNDSPWGSTLAVTALRIARAAVAAGHRLQAVFFRGDGVYNTMMGTAADPGTPDLAAGWSQLAETGETELLVCQSSAKRRLNAPLAAPFREAGLVEFSDRMEGCERVLTF
jgi:tRNA 2-thiouridine synthesizing protein D